VIRELKQRGTSVFLNSHLLSEVEVTCDRVAFVKDGRVVREMTLGDEERGLEVELRLDRAGGDVLAGLARFGSDARADGACLRLRVADEHVIPELARWLVSQGLSVYHLAGRRRTLEEVFLEVVG
jgi:ABC-2 type transport system ATP-binding protein